MLDANLLKLIEKETSKKINPKKNFKENNLDSLDLITIINLIEDEFGIEINENEIKKIKNFKSLFDKVEKKKK